MHSFLNIGYLPFSFWSLSPDKLEALRKHLEWYRPFPNTDLAFNRRAPGSGKGAEHFPAQNLSQRSSAAKEEAGVSLPASGHRQKTFLGPETGSYTKSRVFPLW